MSERHPASFRVGVADLADYPDRIDVRSPAEFEIDHVPGAVNLPVLDDRERARVGTLYVESAFDARKLGATLVARNIAAMLDLPLFDKPRDWRPLVYCWRGGQRSRALAHVLNEIGWRAVVLDGGYRTYRRHVVARIASAPRDFRFVVICGLTGSGKSRFLAALRDAGAQTLDLEGLACHRGSLLGNLPGDPQPSQKAFESHLLAALDKLDSGRVVFIESESRRIGSLQLPAALLERMRRGETLVLSAPPALRVALLKDEYRHYLGDPARLADSLRPLTALVGKAAVARWNAMAASGDWDALIGELLEHHYDPLYERSLGRHFNATSPARTLDVRSIALEGYAALAREFLREFQAAPAAVNS